MNLRLKVQLSVIAAYIPRELTTELAYWDRFLLPHATRIMEYRDWLQRVSGREVRFTLEANPPDPFYPTLYCRYVKSW